MQFRSTKPGSRMVSFREAISRCLPEEGGLYVPDSVMDMRQFFLHMDEDTTYPELVSTVAPVLLQDELNPLSAARVAESAFNFEPELKRLDDRLSVLTLYNGPTGVFKDFGISFMAAVMEEMLKDNGQAMILSAVRGDTGVSIANAFNRRQGMTPVLLYPSGSIRGLDPATFVPNGGNIIPIQIRGTFDDCQRLVNETINDRPFADRYAITCANAINVGRLLPQAFYYLYAFTRVKQRLSGDLLFSVPSGNFGNLISGFYAWTFGMPVNGFIAAMNVNNAFGDFFQGKNFVPHPLIMTKTPAMDVSSPSNYERMASFYEEAPSVMRNMVYPHVVDDQATMEALELAWKRYGILLDPHGAAALSGALSILDSLETGSHVVVLATGHPAKEAETVSAATGQTVQTPPRLHILRQKAEPIALIDPQLDALEGAIASCL
ncbi:MAG: threonine synthase [Treponema sp.]|jgi:threonine synthase|nr:threonine synthase [Treponema sp.]